MAEYIKGAAIAALFFTPAIIAQQKERAKAAMALIVFMSILVGVVAFMAGRAF